MWEYENLCGRHNICVVDTKCVGDTKCVWWTQCVWETQMCVGDTKCVWETQTHVTCYTLHVHVTRICACAGSRAQCGAWGVKLYFLRMPRAKSTFWRQSCFSSSIFGAVVMSGTRTKSRASRGNHQQKSMCINQSNKQNMLQSFKNS